MLKTFKLKKTLKNYYAKILEKSIMQACIMPPSNAIHQPKFKIVQNWVNVLLLSNYYIAFMLKFVGYVSIY